MNKDLIWNEILHTMINSAQQDQKATPEYQYRCLRQEHMKQILQNCLLKEDWEFLEEVLAELDTAAAQDSAAAYRQGMRDCVWMLKNLGVFA